MKRKSRLERQCFKILLAIAGVFSVALLSAQNINLKGFVRDGKTQEPLVGVSIVAKGTTQATYTNSDGSFTLTAPADGTLQLTYIGYSEKEVPVNNNTTINIQMDESTEALDEVVVIGYGKVRKGDATGSVLAIKPEEINKGIQVTAQQALQGKVAGLLVINSGGAPGTGASLRIRGGSSLKASNDPLIVIDGVAIDNSSTAGSSNILSSINPNDIESFTVLKDASSTAIYGSRASNGVIIITTKKGRSGSKMMVNYSNNFGVSYNPKHLDVLSGDEFRAYVKEVIDEKNKNKGENDPVYTANLGNANTDWQKEIFRTALSQEHNLSLTGATKYVPYRFSAGYTNQQGTIKTSNYERYTGNIALSPQLLNNHLQLNINAKGSYEANKFIDDGVVGAAAAFDPTRPVHSDTQYGLGYFLWLNDAGKPISQAPVNPVATLELKNDKSKVYRSIGNAQFDYKIHGFEDLRLNANFGYDILESKGTVFIPDNAPQTWASYDGDGKGREKEYTDKKRNSLLDLYANYVKEFGIHKLDVTGGYSWQHFWKSRDEKETNLDASKTFQDLHRKSEYYLISFFGRLNYILNDKYLFTATLRNDGSSIFSPDNRWGLFPSAAFAWKINEESFLKNARALSELKLRLSYGQTGQQDIGGYYDWQPTYRLSESNADYQFGNDFISTLRPNGYDGGLKWETTTTYNAGLDFGFLNGRISGSIDAYIRKTSDLLNEINVSAGSNLTNRVTTNIGSMENKGIEFSIHAVPVQTKNFSWDIDFNLTYSKSEITKLTLVDNPDYMIDVGNISGGIGSTGQVHSVGYAPYTFYLKKQVYDEDGLPMEGKYENDGAKVKDKKPAPDVFLGFSSKINYKRWTLGFNSHANIGNYVFNSVRSGHYKSEVFGNGTYANMLKFTRDNGFTGAQYWSDYFLSNASFFKLDNVNLGYTIPNFIKSNISLKLIASVENVLTITDYQGLDPEVSSGIDRNIYSRPRIFMFGINLNF